MEEEKKKTESESWRKKEREWEHFLNEGEKERKEGGDKEIRTNIYGGKKKTYGWNEMRESRNSIKNKKS